MIVDLLRNDLGRIARIGSVKVPELFAVEPLRDGVPDDLDGAGASAATSVDLAGLLRALFPCGSITGAPKHRTMEWIAALESRRRAACTPARSAGSTRGERPRCPRPVPARGDPHAHARRRGGATGLRPLTLGVGGGIVHDSVAADEWEETPLEGALPHRAGPRRRAVRDDARHAGRRRRAPRAPSRATGRQRARARLRVRSARPSTRPSRP